MRRWRSLFVGFGAWTLYGVVSAWLEHNSYVFSKKPISWADSLFYEVSFAYIAGALSPLVILLAKRFPLVRPRLLRSAAAHTAGTVVYVVVSRLIWEGVCFVTGHFTGEFTTLRVLRSINWGLTDASRLYWIIVFVHYARDYYRRYQTGLVRAADLNAQLAHAQLQSLRMQLHPHFLFNTLHAISELIHEDPAAAERMIIGLSQLLRLSLETTSAVEVPLRQELHFTQLYLDIEQVRFDDRLKVEMDIDPELNEALVPNLILQPLVENAIKHGISKRPGPGWIRMTAERQDGFLVLKVSDNGAGFDPDKKPLKEGIGLSTIRSRLLKLYGSDQTFHFIKRPGVGAEAVIRLPFRTHATGQIYEYAASSNR